MLEAIKTFLSSKINWTQIIGILATVLGLVGIEMTPEQQVTWVAGVQGAQAFVTAIFRTFFNKPAEPVA